MKRTKKILIRFSQVTTFKSWGTIQKRGHSEKGPSGLKVWMNNSLFPRTSFQGNNTFTEFIKLTLKYGGSRYFYFMLSEFKLKGTVEATEVN